MSNSGKDFEEAKAKMLRDLQNEIIHKMKLTPATPDNPFPDHVPLTEEQQKQYETKPMIDPKTLRQGKKGGCDF